MKYDVVRTCSLFLMFGLVAPTLANPDQLSDIPPPRPPLVASPPEMGRWTITVQQAETPTGEEPDAGSSPSREFGVRSVQSVKTGNLKRDILSYHSGSTSEVWYYQRHVLSTTGGGGSSRVLVQNESALDDPGEAVGVFRELGNVIRSPGYPGFKWVNPSRYEGTVMFDETTPSYHYVLRGRDPTTGENIVAAEAWVHAETGMPAAYKIDGNLYIYSFSEPPDQKLVLPAHFSTALTRLQNTLDRQRRLEADAVR